MCGESLKTGTTVKGNVSGATAVFSLEPVLILAGPPTWRITVILTDVVGTFIAGEALIVNGVLSDTVKISGTPNFSKVCTPVTL